MARKISLTRSSKLGILKFIKLLNADGINVSKAILFGSCAKGNTAADSDIDVAIVSPKFGKDAAAEMMYLRKMSLKVDSRIEPVPFSPLDLADHFSTLANEIRNTGIAITEK
jgi:predicted nucleotidyltransferase